MASLSASLETGLWQWLAKQLASGILPLQLPGIRRHEAGSHPAAGEAHEETRLDGDLPPVLAQATQPHGGPLPEEQSAAPAALALGTLLAAGNVFRPDPKTRGVRPTERPSR
jgi:hypothetical protein